MDAGAVARQWDFLLDSFMCRILNPGVNAGSLRKTG
jgi:hypothetical protein